MQEKDSIKRDPSETMKAPKYMGIPTFMRTPLITRPSEFDIAMIGVPYDGAVSNRPGARHGPREIRNASTMMRSIHHVTRVNPYSLCRIGDAGDVPFENVYDPEAAHQDITQFFSRVHSAGVVALAAGGDHSITLPILRTHASKGPVGLIHIDAHTDTWDGSMGSKFTHGTPFRRAVEEGLLDPKRTVQIGIRGTQNTSEGWDYSHDNGMRVIFIEEFLRLGVQAVIAETRRVVGKGPAYISFDIDGLDPVYAPGTGTPEVGGLTTIDAQALLRGLRGSNLIGADVVEVAPPYDPRGNTALVGATMMYEILCLLAESVAVSKQEKQK
ncbi:MAG TPA: agmatinase [Deltaproteobacteria bacterium]|nr:agmatinase [Deltaproteobacteria bacterium]